MLLRPILAAAAFALAALISPAQILHPTAPLPTFEVAVIKPSNGWLPFDYSPIEFHQPNVTALLLIEQAYHLPLTFGSNVRILNEPDWITSNRYDVDAKIEGSLAPVMEKLTGQKRAEQMDLRLQSLLAERFKLKVHFEKRNLKVYALVVAKGGPKLTPAKDLPPASITKQQISSSPPPGIPRPEDMHKGTLVLPKEQGEELTAKIQTLDDLARELQMQIPGRVILNQTGLSGGYDYTMHWVREGPADQQEGASQGNAEWPDIRTALREQLGLQLITPKAPIEVIVIDHIERPSPN
jgi:bla regulator protein BlaR1